MERIPVSVVVPLFNQGRYVRRCLSSISAQTVPEFEALIVDDGSTDDGAAAVPELNDGRFRLLTQSNQGPGAARNRGIAEARGDLITFLDADDSWHPRYLENALGLFARSGTTIAATACGYREYPHGRSTRPMWEARRLREGIAVPSPDTEPAVMVHRLAYMTSSSTVARREVITEYGGFVSNGCRYGEDATLWLKVLLNWPVYFSLEPLVDIHKEGSSLSRRLQRREIEPFLLDPSQVDAWCPLKMKPLLKDVLAIRASKTVAALGYWGEWRSAKNLASKYSVFSRHDDPALLLCALVGCTPLGGVLGSLHRTWTTFRHNPAMRPSEVAHG